MSSRVKHTQTPVMNRPKYIEMSGGNSYSLTWEDVDSAAILNIVRVVTAVGDALVFGTTSDGGALMLSVLSGGASDKFYFSEVEAANSTLNSIVTGVKAWQEAHKP